jgi:hypothetical protein
MPRRPDNPCPDIVLIEVEFILNHDVRIRAHVVGFQPVCEDLRAGRLSNLNQASGVVSVCVSDDNQADVVETDSFPLEPAGDCWQLALGAGIDEHMPPRSFQQERLYEPESQGQQTDLNVVHRQMLPAGTGQGQGSPLD